MINSNELEDFITILKKHGYSENDFIFEEQCHSPQIPNVIVPLEHDVIVSCKSTAKKNPMMEAKIHAG